MDLSIKERRDHEKIIRLRTRRGERVRLRRMERTLKDIRDMFCKTLMCF